MSMVKLMFFKKIIQNSVLMTLFGISSVAVSGTGNYVTEYEDPSESQLEYRPWQDFHRKNPPVYPGEVMLERSCADLDEEISHLIPNTYQYKPDFYDDAYNGAAIWGAAAAPVTLAYLPYSWVVSYQDDSRQHQAFYRIEKLRRAKQMKQCFE